MTDPGEALGRIRAHALAIARELAQFGEPESALSAATSTDPEPAALRLVKARAWQRASEARRPFFEDSDTLFIDPAWDILLDLYIEERTGRSTTISSACIASKVPTTTGLRWIQRLESMGLIARSDDAHDKRRVYISLTDDARGKMESALDAAAESDRRLGLRRL